MTLRNTVFALLSIVSMLLAGCTEAIPVVEGEADLSCQLVAEGEFRILFEDGRGSSMVTVLGSESTNSSAYSDEPHCLLPMMDAISRHDGNESFGLYQIVSENATPYVNRPMISGTVDNPVLYSLSRNETGHLTRHALNGERLANGSISWANDGEEYMMWAPCDNCLESSLRGTFVINQNTFLEENGTVSYDDYDGDGVPDIDEVYGCFNPKALNHDVNVTEHLEETCEFPTSAVDYYTQIVVMMFELHVNGDVNVTDDLISHLQDGDLYYIYENSVNHPEEDMGYNKTNLISRWTNTSINHFSCVTNHTVTNCENQNHTVDEFLTDYTFNCSNTLWGDEIDENLTATVGAYALPFGEHESLCLPVLRETNRRIECVSDVWNGEEYYYDVEIREFNNGYEFCFDGSDEYNASSPQDFPCLDGTNISLELVNDGALDCPDGSDEPVNDGHWVFIDTFVVFVSDRHGSWEIVSF